MKNKFARKSLEIFLTTAALSTVPEIVPSLYAVYNEPNKVETVENVPRVYSGLSELARKNIADLTPKEKIKIVRRLRIAESSGNPNAVSRVITHRYTHGRVVPDTAIFVGENQIGKSALADYNRFHKRKFTHQEMFNSRYNRRVSQWYRDIRLPQILKDHGRETTVANVLASYNAGPGVFIRSGGDAARYFNKLPNDTQRYITQITKEGD